MTDLKKEAEQFFAEFVRVSEQYDPAVIHVYTDDARVRTKRIMADGAVREMELTGAQWKGLLVKALPVAQQSGDVSKFSNITYRVKGDTVTIKADRFSVLKCYNDTGYYLVLKKTADGLKIVEEYSETRLVSQCAEPNKGGLPALLALARKGLEGHLPLMVDEETRLDVVSVRENVFEYQFTLINEEKESSFFWMFEGKMRPVLLQQSCTAPNLRPILEYGGILSYLYQDKNGKPYAHIRIDREDCLNWESKDPGAVKGTAREVIERVRDVQYESDDLDEVLEGFLLPCWAILDKLPQQFYEEMELAMLKLVPPKLGCLYLIHRFESVLADEGMQGAALMNTDEALNIELLEKMAAAFRLFGDRDKAVLLEELIPVARQARQKIEALNAKDAPDEELQPWWDKIDAFTPRYEALRKKADVYKIILDDMKKNTADYLYINSRQRQP